MSRVVQITHAYTFNFSRCALRLGIIDGKYSVSSVHESLQNFVSMLEFTPPLIMLCGEFVLMSKPQVLLTSFSNWVCGSVGKAQLKYYHSSAVTRVWCPSMGLTSTGCFASVDILVPKEVFHYHDTLKNYNHLVLYNASDSLLSFLFLQLFRRKKSTNQTSKSLKDGK